LALVSAFLCGFILDRLQDARYARGFRRRRGSYCRGNFRRGSRRHPLRIRARSRTRGRRLRRHRLLVGLNRLRSGIGFDDLQRIQDAGNQGIESDE
jgi:hypothetical protein